MIKTLVVRLLATALAFATAARLIPSFDVEGGVAAYLWLAVVFGVVNAIVGPVLRVVAFPVTVLTLGLFALVVNGVLIAIVAGLSEHLQVGSFGWTVLAAVVVSVVSAVVQAVGSRTVARSR